MSIKVVRLISGEELLGEWDSENFKISSPVVMVPVTKDQLGFQPWIPYAEEEDIVLKDQHIMAVCTPDKKLQNEYNRVFGSGLIMPEEEKIIH